MLRVTELDSIKIIAHMNIREEIFTFFLLYYFLFAQYLYADQNKHYVSMGIDIMPRPSHPGGTVTSAAPSSA
jgi:hypothetical protein